MISQRVVLKFSQETVDKPIICHLAKNFDLSFNILKAYITPRKEGLLILELEGGEEEYKKGVEYLNKVGVEIQSLSQDIFRDEKRCTHCGACVGFCPSGALVFNRETWEVNFFNDKCIACEFCLKACPLQAMKIHF